MARLSTLILLVALSMLSLADIFTLSIGDIGQYSASLATTPTLTGTRVMFTAAADASGGVDVVFSEDLRTNMKSAIDNNCKDINTQCIDSVNDLLINPHTELETRQAIIILAGAEVFAFIAVIIPMLSKDRDDGVPVALHLPSGQLAPAASAAQASTIAVITKSAAPAVTITRKPGNAIATGSDTPTQTTLVNAQDGHVPGDVAIYLSADLARRMTEMIQRTRQCDAGNDLAKPKGVAMKDNPSMVAADMIGAMVCGAQALVLNASPGAAFADLASFQGKLPMWSSPDLVQAMQHVASYAVARARTSNTSPEVATTVGYVAFYLAFRVIKDKVALSEANWYAKTDLEGSAIASMPTASITPTLTITATSMASSSSVLECSASCAMIGHIRDCNTWCPTPTDDSYTPPSQYVVKTVAFIPWTVPVQVPISLPTQVPEGSCPAPPRYASDFPLDLFGTVYAKFCEQADKATQSMNWIVNAQGDQIGHKLRRFRFALRDGSTNTEKYKDYRFMLAKSIRDGEKRSCSRTCARTFELLSLSDMCKRGDDKKAIASTGSLDSGCAEYIFSIEVPEAPKPQKPDEIKADIICGDPKSLFSAPKYDSGANGASGVESAITQWCADKNQFYLNENQGSDVVYGRWDITQLGVPKRSSFWPRARLNSSNKGGVIVREQCIAAYTDALKKCDPGSDRTHGFSARVGTTEYSLEISGMHTPQQTNMNQIFD